MIAYQRAFIYHQAMRNRRSHVVYPGMELFQEGNRLLSPHEIPGVLEAGWHNLHLITPRGVSDRDRSHSVSKLNGSLKALFDKVYSHPDAWPFEEPVTEDQV
jgi:histone acetyltransferase